MSIIQYLNPFTTCKLHVYMFLKFCSQCRRGLCCMGQTSGEGPTSPNQLHCPPNGVAGGAHHGASGAEELW